MQFLELQFVFKQIHIYVYTESSNFFYNVEAKIGESFFVCFKHV